MNKKYELVCFDLDGTLIEEDSGQILWQRMAKLVHDGDHVDEERMKKYKEGNLKLVEWAELDLSDWKSYGVTKEFLITQSMHSKLLPGVKKTLHELKNRGVKLAVISGSINVLLDTVFPDHPFDDVFINELFFDENDNLSHWKIDGLGNIDKAEVLKMIAKRENISLEKTVFVGDHLNDITAAKIAGLSVAFNSNCDELKAHCDVIIDKKDMTLLLSHLFH